MIIECTKKLADAMKIKLNAYEEGYANPIELLKQEMKEEYNA